MTGTLYVCATPIGNLEDVSHRLLSTLRAVELIAAEDTRHSLQLLRHFAIETPLISYHEHSAQSRTDTLVAQLLAGKDIALISDAGTPGISDPGELLINACIENGIKLAVVPGPMAGVAALILSGLPTGRFAFEGFLPRSRKERREVLAKLMSEERTMVFYESPHRLQETLADMVQVWGNRKVALARELTKIFEEVKRVSLTALLEDVEVNGVRGELVLIVEGAKTIALSQSSDKEDSESLLALLLAQGLSAAQASRHAAKLKGVPRAELYALAVRLSQEK